MHGRVAAASLVALVAGRLAAQSTTPPPDTLPAAVRVTPVASVTNYLIANSHPFFGAQARSWMETSVLGGGRVELSRAAVELVGLAVRTGGDDPYGTRGAGSPISPWGLAVDRAALTVATAGARPVTLTVGRQHIEIGSQFLIGDGVYDGAVRGLERAVYHTPRRSFDAVRLQGEAAGTRLDAFGYLVSPTWDAGGGRDGRVVGVDASRRFDRAGSAAALGLVYRGSRSDLDNDMTALDLRLEQRMPGVPALRASGELVVELGRCRNAYYCDTPGAAMRGETGWHAELRHEDSTSRGRPSLELGAVRYSRDFTPIAPGFADWGRWYLGNQIDWIAFGSNAQVLRAEAGLWPRADLRVRAQYHDTRQVAPTGTSAGGALSDEVSLIGEWYPTPRLWLHLVLGHANAGPALAGAGLGNPFGALNADAVRVGGRSSRDAVLATGFTF